MTSQMVQPVNQERLARQISLNEAVKEAIDNWGEGRALDFTDWVEILTSSFASGLSGIVHMAEEHGISVIPVKPEMMAALQYVLSRMSVQTDIHQ